MQAQQKLFNKIVFTHFLRKIKVPQFAFDKVQSLLIAPSVALLFFFPLFSFQGANGFCALWWRIAGSNRWPPECKSGALPAELIPRMKVVGPSGLEPPTLRLSVVRSSQLSYGPIFSRAQKPLRVGIPSKLNNVRWSEKADLRKSVGVVTHMSP